MAVELEVLVLALTVVTGLMMLEMVKTLTMVLVEMAHGTYFVRIPFRGSHSTRCHLCAPPRGGTEWHGA